jgi:thioester reductase-like protein
VEIGSAELICVDTLSLLRLAHAGRPKAFAFASSISTSMGPSSSPSVSEEPIGADPNIALSTGYAQSKFISMLPS